MRTEDGSFADSQRILVTQGFLPWTSEPGTVNTTIGFVVTNGKFNKTQMNKAAALCSNGLVRAIRPVNTTADGDSLYALATGEVEADSELWLLKRPCGEPLKRQRDYTDSRLYKIYKNNPLVKFYMMRGFSIFMNFKI